jgi:hypothetical protein
MYSVRMVTLALTEPEQRLVDCALWAAAFGEDSDLTFWITC